MRTLMIKVSELGIRQAANTLVITLFSVLLPITSLHAQGAGDTSYDGTTAWGDPDLQGLWTNETRTPMERPVELGNKAFFTEEDVQAMRAAAEPAPVEAIVEEVSVPAVGGNVGAHSAIWLDQGEALLSTRQTSLIVDPPNGRAPLRDSAWQAREYRLQHLEDDYLNFTPWDRCITRGVPGAMLPAAYNNAYRIIQTPDHVAIMHEMIHEVRIIPLDKSDHNDERIKLWMGDSVARWEGNTLVVETTNFHGRGMIANSGAGGRLRGVSVTEDLHLVERFTRIDEDTIIWEVTITDPDIYMQPFTISMPLNHDPDYVIYEYACHEGNQAIRNILSAGREREKREAAEL
ncbi:MAG: hypothetical protein CNF02_09225 [OM182 bacterium MED-G28]|uniref:Uncharacterized protein n=1 Tax=OM182 bacterium MED-G28 TaxID=1986256 RepID=A0A2A5WAP9_9GAMM|nr:MAG: hypothetical protein CNF02_09225 [OM182 bacterium MED-G28]